MPNPFVTFSQSAPALFSNDFIRAEIERMRAETERVFTETERIRAETEQIHTESERLRMEIAEVLARE